MLDIKFIRENPQLVQKASADKNFSVDITGLLELDAEIRPLQLELETLQAERNTLSKDIGKAAASERERMKAQVVILKSKMEELQEVLRVKKQTLQELLLKVPQPARADVPLGKDDRDNVEVKRWGEPRQFNFKADDHINLGKRLGMIDFERGVKLSGSRSYVLTGDGALLEQALLRYAYDLLQQKGYTPVSVPVLVNEDVMQGTGYFPLGREQAYCVEKDKMALVGTAEVPLCGLHAGEVFDEAALPLRYMAQSSCFRREAGTYGKDTKGLYRVHQFQKIEMVVIAPADEEQSEQLHRELLGIAEAILQALELPYRVVYVCTGDLGQGQVRKHDIETWMPSRQNYGETHSCSSFHDFQARRLDIRYKSRDGERRIAYTLNNTALATPRVILALLENHQTADGRIQVPACLQPYLGGRSHLG